MKRSRGGLVFKAHRLLYHSTLGLRVIKKKKKARGLPLGFRGYGFGLDVLAAFSGTRSPRSGASLYRGTSLIRNCPPLGPYSRTMPKALWCPGGGGGSYERGTPVGIRGYGFGLDVRAPSLAPNHPGASSLSSPPIRFYSATRPSQGFPAHILCFKP